MSRERLKQIVYSASLIFTAIGLLGASGAQNVDAGQDRRPTKHSSPTATFPFSGDEFIRIFGHEFGRQRDDIDTPTPEPTQTKKPRPTRTPRVTEKPTEAPSLAPTWINYTNAATPTAESTPTAEILEF
jgi:hypothetical protein